MTGRRSILANIAALGAGQAIAMVLGLLTHAILARAVGPADYGVLGFAVAVISYFGILGALGTDAWATREIAAERTRARAIAGAVASLRVILGAAAFAGVVALVLLWDRDAAVSTVVMIQGAGLFAAALTLDFAFQGLERMDAVARRQVSAAVIALAGVAAVVSFGGGIIAAAAVLQAALFAAALVMVGEFTALAGFPAIGRAAVARWREMLRDAAPLAVTSVVATIYASIDIVMLGFLRPGDEVGHYVAAVRIFAIGMVATAIFRTAFAPVLARLVAAVPERKEAGGHHARAVAAMGGLIAAIGFVLAPEILAIVYGDAFAPAESALRILMINLLVTYAVEVFHTQLVAWRLQMPQMWIMLAGALFNVALNLWAIPRFGMVGAAATTFASTCLVLVLAAVALHRRGFETHGAAMAGVGALALALILIGTVAAAAIDAGPALMRFAAGALVLALVYVAAARAIGIVRIAETLGYLSRRP